MGAGRLRPQLLLEHRPAPLELVDGLRGAAQEEAEPHHFLMRLFAQRIVVGETTGDRQGVLVCGVGLVGVDQASQGRQVPASQEVLLE